ncbi:MAG: hypothetical protein ACRCWG_03135 [Sarcina sp.]
MNKNEIDYKVEIIKIIEQEENELKLKYIYEVIKKFLKKER